MFFQEKNPEKGLRNIIPRIFAIALKFAAILQVHFLGRIIPQKTNTLQKSSAK